MGIEVFSQKPKRIPHFVFKTFKPGRFGSFIDPKWEEVAAIKKAMLEELEDEFRQGIERGSEELRVDLAVVLRALDKKEEAIEELEKAESRKDRHAYYPLGRMYLEHGALRSGEDNDGTTLSAITGYLQKAIQLDPDNIPAHFFLGKALKELIQQESNEKIIEVFETYLQADAPLGFEEEAQSFLNSQNPKLQLKANLKEAKEELENEELADAIKLLEKVIEIEEEERFYGEYAEGDWNELEKREREAAETAGRDLVEALFFLGQAYERVGNLSKALEAYRRAKTIKVNFLGLEQAFGETLWDFYKDTSMLSEGIQAFHDRYSAITEDSENKQEKKALQKRKEELLLIRNVIGGVSDTWIETFASSSIVDVEGDFNTQVLCRMDVSPDGKEILLKAEDSHDLLLADLEGIPQVELKGHKDIILCAAYSPDGSLILSSSKDKTVRLWNREGQEVMKLTGHEEAVSCLAFSADGNFMLTASGDTDSQGDDYKVRLYDSQGNLLQTMAGFEDQISSVAFSPDQASILTASVDGKVCLWDLEGQLQHKLDVGDNAITSATFSPDGVHILLTGTDHYLALWKDRGGKWEPNIFNKVAENTYHGTFSSDGKRMLITTEIGKMLLLSLQGKILETIQTPEVPITYASFVDEEERIYGVSSFGHAYIWESPKAQWRKLVAYGQKQLKK